MNGMMQPMGQMQMPFQQMQPQMNPTQPQARPVLLRGPGGFRMIWMHHDHDAVTLPMPLKLQFPSSASLPGHGDAWTTTIYCQQYGNAWDAATQHQMPTTSVKSWLLPARCYDILRSGADSPQRMLGSDREGMWDRFEVSHCKRVGAAAPTRLRLRITRDPSKDPSMYASEAGPDFLQAPGSSPVSWL